METLADCNSESHDAISRISDQFAKTHLMIGELLRVIQDVAAMDTLAANNAHLAAYATSLKAHETEKAVTDAKANIATLKETLGVAQGAYERASKNFPSSTSNTSATIFC